jgi:prolyl-tRNA synthetase
MTGQTTALVFKFNEWELKGIPLRIELGPKDLENKQVVVVRRDTGEKETVKFDLVKDRVAALLEEIQDNLFSKAKKKIDESLVNAEEWKEFLKHVKDRKYVRAPHCADKECEAKIKEESEGVKTTCIPFNQPKINKKCVRCDKAAKYEVLFAKSY